METSNNTLQNNVRIPRNFIPLKYDLDFYIDIRNITYNLINDLYIQVENDNYKVVVLNALNSAYKIKSVKAFKYDMISDHYIEEGDCKYSYNKDVTLNLKSEVIKDKYEELFGDVAQNEQPELEYEEKLKMLIDALSKDFDNVCNWKHLVLHRDINLISYLEGKVDLNVIEESVYIILPENSVIRKGDIIRLKIEVEGSIYLSSEKKCGLYFCLFGNDANLLINKEDFLKRWQDDNINHDLKRNFVICALNEPVDCRTYFPSFDEPSYKAKFNVKITIDSKYAVESNYLKVLSNGDLIDIVSNSEKSKLTYVFSESPLMSTYLLTFVIGNFEYLESMVGKIRMRVYTPLSSQIEGSFAIEIARKSLEFYQKYFKLPYSFSKIDLVPVPAMDYRAMENWGCIVYLNYALMANKFLDIKERKNIARTNSHELSHMWFGNLVTMDWWDDIWLNEGFARYMEFECLEEIKPEFEIWSKYIELIYQTAMEIDEKPTTHPVICAVPSPRDLMNIFDTISYAKGASMIRMLSYLVGKEKFRMGVLMYLEKYQYSNTTTKNLWTMFKDITDFDVKKIMDVWLNQSGHPILNVTIQENKDNNATLIIEQSPFPKNFNSAIENPIWKIPLFIKTKSGEHIIMMEDKRIELDIQQTLHINYQEIIEMKDFIKVNNDMKGFYRVFYFSDTLINCLLANHNLLSKLDISGLLSDYFAFNDIKTCLHILDSIKPINDYLLLYYANKVFKHIKQYVFQFSCFNHFLMKEDFHPNYKYEEIIKSENACKIFYGNLISLDINKIKDKIFVKNPQFYLNEKNDEFEELSLYFYCFAKKDKDLIEYIVTNFEKEFIRIHKNFKYLVYNVVVNYAYKILNDTEKELTYYKMILNEYKDNFYQYSLQTRNEYKTALSNLEESSDSLIDYFTTMFHDDLYIRNLYFKNFNLFVSYPVNRLRFLHSYVRMIRNNFDEVLSLGMDISFQDFIFKAKHLKLFFYEFPLLFSDIFDENLKKRIIEFIIKEILLIGGSVNFEIVYNIFSKKHSEALKAELCVVNCLNYFINK